MRRGYYGVAFGVVLLALVLNWGCGLSGVGDVGTVGRSPEALRAEASGGGTGERLRVEAERTEVPGTYTYWIELTSFTAEEGGKALQRGSMTPPSGQSQRFYIPFFAIDKGQYAIRLKSWERDDGQRAVSLPEDVYGDRDLTVEGGPIDLVRGFQNASGAGPASEADQFRHTVYGHGSATGLLEAQFKITREPNQFATQTEADLALFDRRLVDVYVRDAQDSRGPLSCLATLGKRAAATLVDLLLIIDRIFAKPTSVTTPDYLARVSQPSSRFYKDSVAYQQGHIAEDELIRRLPHAAMIGDSLTKNAYISSTPSMLWRVRTEHQRNWFLDAERSPDGIYSVYKRVAELTPLVAVEYSGVGANVGSGKGDQTFVQMLMKTGNFSQQVDQVVEGERFPDLLLVWIGHNNLNWAAPLSPEERTNPDKHLLWRLWRFRKHYAYQLQRLVDRAKKEKQKSVIVGYGLVNFAAFFEARETAEALKAKDPDLYPYLERDLDIYESMKPEYRKNMIRLALMMNSEIRDVVAGLNQELRDYPNVRLKYSDALAMADISAVELIHPMDAWHPSVKGHNRLAEAAFSAFSEDLVFLGIRSKER